MEQAAPSPRPAAPAVPPVAALVWGALLSLLPVAIAVLQLGRWHPDEVYQSLEPAYFRVHGYGTLAWEWTREGALRNWAVPILYSWILRLADLLGITNPRIYRGMIGVPQLLLHAWALRAVYRYTRRRAGPKVALTAMMFVGLSAPVLLFGGRSMGEAQSADLLLIALELCDLEAPSLWQALGGGVALGLSVVVRYGSGMFVLGALAWLVACRRFRTLAWVCLGGVVVAAGLGALDWATWGQPFQSLLRYLGFNVFSGGAAAQFGASPWYWYLARGELSQDGYGPLWAQLPLWALVGGVWATRWEKRLPLPWVCALVYLVAVSLTPHKEDRFLYPAVILMLMGAAPPIAAWVLSRRMPWPPLLSLLVLGLGAVPFGFHPDFRGDQFRGIVYATRDANATGLLVVADGRWGSGGSFYIGKNIPWTNTDFPAQAVWLVRADPRFNRVVCFENHAVPELLQAGFEIEKQIGRETVMARRGTWAGPPP